MGKDEVKLSAIILYYIFVGVMVVIFFTYFLQTDSEIEQDLNDFILCKTVGNEDCRIKATITNVRGLSIAYAISGAFLPVVIVFFSFDMDNFIGKCRKKPQMKELKT